MRPTHRIPAVNMWTPVPTAPQMRSVAQQLQQTLDKCQRVLEDFSNSDLLKNKHKILNRCGGATGVWKGDACARSADRLYQYLRPSVCFARKSVSWGVGRCGCLRRQW